jgi:predicted RNase H-like HicB family nuclease
MKQCAIICERGPRNWSAYSPDVPGCVATGKTREGVERNMKAALEFHIEGLRLHGDPIPEAACEAGTLAVLT